MLGKACLVGLMGLTSAAGVYWFRRAAGERLTHRLTLLLLPVTFVLIAAACMTSVLGSMETPWLAARVTPLFALRYGYRRFCCEVLNRQERKARDGAFRKQRLGSETEELGHELCFGC